MPYSRGVTTNQGENIKSAISTAVPTARWKPAALLAVVLGILSFVSGPTAPLGFFWRPAPGFPTPSPVQLPLFIGLGLAEAITFGLGISFLFFGYPMVRPIYPASTTLTRLAHFCIASLLFSWWPHDSLHIHVGEASVNGLLAIEYAFHVTLMIAGVILAYFFLTLVRQADQRGSSQLRG